MRTRATAAAVGSILLWCASGVCFTSGARLMGPMAYLTLMTATGVLTVAGLQFLRRRPLGDLVYVGDDGVEQIHLAFAFIADRRNYFYLQKLGELLYVENQTSSLGNVAHIERQHQWRTHFN